LKNFSDFETWYEGPKLNREAAGDISVGARRSAGYASFCAISGGHTEALGSPKSVKGSPPSANYSYFIVPDNHRRPAGRFRPLGGPVL
jgi:hypothetical protein